MSRNRFKVHKSWEMKVNKIVQEAHEECKNDHPNWYEKMSEAERNEYNQKTNFGCF